MKRLSSFGWLLVAIFALVRNKYNNNLTRMKGGALHSESLNLGLNMLYAFPGLISCIVPANEDQNTLTEKLKWQGNAQVFNTDRFVSRSV